MTTTKTDAPELLAWTDIETTGLDPHDGHAVLEVACILTDTQLREVADPYHRVLQYDEAQVAQMQELADDFVLAMHQKSGLWNKLPTGLIAPTELDDDLLAFITKHAPSKRQARMAGSSVRLDMNFLDHLAPKTMAHLHYRFLDSSGLAYFAQETSGFQMPVKASAHEALADIRASIDLAKTVATHYESLKKSTRHCDEP